MTQPDEWDGETERLTRSYWDGCMGDEISVSRSELADALRSAYAEGEKARMEKAAVIADQRSSGFSTAALYLSDEKRAQAEAAQKGAGVVAHAIRAAKETKT